MYRARAETNPRVPANAEEFATLIQSVPRYKYMPLKSPIKISKLSELTLPYSMDLNGENQFFFGRVTAGNLEALIFVNVGALQAFVDAVALHMDATFRTHPRGYYQLGSLHAIAHGHSIQIAAFLMTGKTQALYEACLARILQVCRQQTGENKEMKGRRAI